MGGKQLMEKEGRGSLKLMD